MNAHDLRLAGGKFEDAGASATDRDGKPALDGLRPRRAAVDGIVVAFEEDPHRKAEDLDRLGPGCARLATCAPAANTFELNEEQDKGKPGLPLPPPQATSGIRTATTMVLANKFRRFFFCEDPLLKPIPINATPATGIQMKRNRERILDVRMRTWTKPRLILP